MQKILSILFILIISINSNDFGFFYDNNQDKIYFDLEKYDKNNESFLESDLFSPKNLKQHYYSSAGINQFKIEYYSTNISSLSSESLDLIKVEYNLTEHENVLIREVILNMEKISQNIFPQKYKDEFIVTQNKEASNKGKEKRKTLIYDTLGFNIISKNKLNFKISKILLINNRKNKLNYLSNLSYNVRKYASNTTFDIYLKNMPEDFNLFITLDLCDKKWNATGEKVLVVQKDFDYPNYEVEESNPNKTMLIISITFIILAFILTIIFVLLKLIIGCF